MNNCHNSSLYAENLKQSQCFTISQKHLTLPLKNPAFKKDKNGPGSTTELQSAASPKNA